MANDADITMGSPRKNQNTHLRVLHVVGWLAPRYGGTVSAVSELVPELTNRGHYVEVWTTNADGRGVLPVTTNHRVEWNGMRVVFHTLNRPHRYLTSWSLLSRLVHEVHRFDIVHIHSLYRFHTVAASRIARARGIPYVLQVHGALDPWNRNVRRKPKDLYHAAIENGTLRGAAALICTARQEAEAIQGLGLGLPTRIIPLGVRPPADALYDGLPVQLPGEMQIITFLGRLSPVKGLDILTDAFVSIAAEFPKAHLVIAGPDDHGIMAGLAPKLEAAGLTARSSILGQVDETTRAALLERTAVLVLPSAGESFGLSAAEAMAAGRPVVVTPRVAIHDAIASAGAGIVAPRTASNVALAVKTILADSDRARRMGSAGMRLAASQYQWPVVAAAMEVMYREVLAGAGAHE